MMASNNELFEQRIYRRSVSESVNELSEINNACLSERKTRMSETYDDTRELEDIVTCSIHLGIMDDPKKLFCQHAFCYKCLKDYSKTCVDLVCPICRVKEKSNVDKLPPALTEKQLIDIVMKHRMNKCMEESQKEDALSDERKEELVKHLLKEINSSNGIYKVTNSNDSITNENTIEDPAQTTSYLENRRNDSASSLTYDMMDIETIRENMLKYSQYEIKRDAVQKLNKTLFRNKTENLRLDFSIFDISICEAHPKSNQLVLVDSQSSKLFFYSETEIRTFFIYLDGQIIKPDYIRIYRGDLMLSGRFERNGTIFSCFLQCNIHGKILRQSELYSWQEPSSRVPMMLGFDMNEKDNKYYLCMPRLGNVRIFNSSLVESQHYFEFDDNQPEYVAFSSSLNQLWISCPHNRKILIIDVDSGSFRLFNTEQINKAVPKMIFVTDDDKVIFLDTRGNRFIWIKRRNEYILTQKLTISSLNRDLKICTFHVLPFSMIIVGTETGDISIFQAAKYFSKSRRIYELCHVL